MDTREKWNSIRKVLEKHEVGYEVSTLPAGDYWIPHESGKPVIVERSTYTDFVGKIVSGRVWTQTDKMMAYTDPDKIYWVLENPYLLKKTKVRMESLYGVILGLASRGIHVLSTRNQTETGIVIYLLFKRYSIGSVGKIKPYRKNIEVMDDWTEVLNVLIGFNGVGVKKAEKWLSTAGSLANAINMDYDELSSTIGRGLASNVHRLIHKDFMEDA